MAALLINAVCAAAAAGAGGSRWLAVEGRRSLSTDSVKG